jgi:hypothetical protein
MEQGGLYCTDVAVQPAGDQVTCQVRMFILVCDANRDPQVVVFAR